MVPSGHAIPHRTDEENRQLTASASRTDPQLLPRSKAAFRRCRGGSQHRSAEEDAALELMVRLIKDCEEEHHPLPDPSPREMLVYLMEQRSLKQADLLPIFKSRGYVSDVINAKRAISKVHAKELADFFKVSADLFI